MADKAEKSVTVYPAYHGEAFLTGGLIGVALIIATLLGTWSIESAWAPQPVVVREYMADSPGYDLIYHGTLKAEQEELGACRKDNKDWAKKYDADLITGANLFSGNSVSVSTGAIIPYVTTGVGGTCSSDGGKTYNPC